MAGNTKIHVRFGGSCSGCGKWIQATPTLKTSSKLTEAWIRCGNCGQITLCEQDATKPAGKLTDSDE